MRPATPLNTYIPMKNATDFNNLKKIEKVL